MTPDELRKLADEATPGPWVPQSARDYDSERAQVWLVCTKDDEPETWQGVAECDLDRPFENTRLIALAPDLARLCAELGEALEKIVDLDDDIHGMGPGGTVDYYEGLQEAAKVARPALAKLSELEPR